MDAYLDIAVTILKSEKRPLSARAILATAYRNGLVPVRLHGKTQHKTLQARLSEDIIARREHSPFFRTAPGFFFLREFLTDTSLPEEFRLPFPTRRRFRELLRGPALAIDYNALRDIAEENTAISPQKIYDLLRAECCRYKDPSDKYTNSVFVRSFVCVYRETDILTYRLGRYRDDRDNFMSKRSIGFSALVHVDAHTLFNLGDFGIVDSGVQATKVDLDVPDVPTDKRVEASLSYFIWSRQASCTNDLLAVIAFECPKWFEPVKRRLALNDLAWLDCTKPVNDVDDFDPWSKTVLLAHYKLNAGSNAEFAPSAIPV
ncbi:MAG TPA: winged helix-turn-helix domain-containing protein [Stellaceae bacterium]|nr:winged helix-turn-helix domain-containing protein [Stellaceae bacterium]